MAFYPISSSPLTFIIVWLLHTVLVHAATPDVIVSIEGEDKDWMAKRAVFGSEAERLQGLLVHSPAYDELLCEYYNPQNKNVTPVEDHEPWIMLVPRGVCTFERKLYAAKQWYKASGILVYDNLSARYRYNNKTQKMTYPRDEHDYECSKGYGFVYNIELDPPPYSHTVLDPILDMTSPTTNCTLEQTLEPCESQLCLVTGPPKDENSTTFPVCCAWDLPVTMLPDEKAPGNVDDVMAVFLTIRQGEAIVEYVGKTVVIEARPYAPFNSAMIFLWIMGVAIAGAASWFAASDLRIFRAKMARYQQAKEQKNLERLGVTPEQAGDVEAPRNDNLWDDAMLDNLVGDLDDIYSDDEKEDEAPGKEKDEQLESETEQQENVTKKKKKPQKKWSVNSIPPKGKEKDKGKVWVLYSLPPPERKAKKSKQRKGYKAEPTAETDTLPTDGGMKEPEPWATPINGFEMTQWHVFGFLISASALLFLLFYFRFYAVVFIFYGFGCAGAVSYLIFGPVLVRVVPLFGDAVVKEMNKGVLCGLNAFDITSQMMGFIWAIIWVWYGLSHYRPSTNAFFWISMDIFGACFCILALSMVKLSSIKIATMLLVAVFFYDIFFVFLTPLFMGQSVMITVAKGGSTGVGGDDFCVKYPDDKDCTGIDFLPMLLAVPRINDYRGGMALLGLGDIVLPGYLIAFCARLDEAKRIVGKHTKIEMEFTEKWYKGYFFWLMVGYGLGLGLAFLAFGLTGVGQPALLYLVPCCLGMISIVGRKELKDMWKGARAIKLAEKVKTKCERAWGKEKMRRTVAKHREAVEAQSMSRGRSAPVLPRGSVTSGGRGPGGRGRGRGGSTRISGRGRGPNGSSKRSSVRSASPSKNRPGRSVSPSKDRQDSTERNRSSVRSSSPGKNRPQRSVSPSKDRQDATATSQLPNSRCSPVKSNSEVVGPPQGSPGSPRRRYTATLDGASPSPRRASKRVSSQGAVLPEKPNIDDDGDTDTSPKENDVCFGSLKCLGTKHLKTAVKRELKADPQLEFSRTILKSIYQRLEGRKFFVSDGSGGWREASKGETRIEISKVFNAEKSKLIEQD